MYVIYCYTHFLWNEKPQYSNIFICKHNLIYVLVVKKLFSIHLYLICQFSCSNKHFFLLLFSQTFKLPFVDFIQQIYSTRKNACGISIAFACTVFFKYLFLSHYVFMEVNKTFPNVPYLSYFKEILIT